MIKRKPTKVVKLRKAQLERLINFSPAVHYVSRASGDFGATYISSEVNGQLGYEPSQFTNDPNFWVSRIHPEDSANVFANLEQLFEKDKDVLEYRFLHADGGYRWMHDRLSLIRDKRGGPLEIVGSWLDITARKGVEEQLRQSEARLIQAQRIAGIGSWEWDINSNELWWSDEIYHIFGADPQSFKSNYEAFLEHVHPEDRKSVSDAIERALEHRDAYSMDHRIVLPDGTMKFVHEQAEVYVDVEGNPIRMVGTVQDISEQEALEAQLRQSQKMEAVGTLAGGIAHDFNNLLTVIHGHSELLLESIKRDDPSHHDLSAIKKASDRAATLTRQLLAFSSKQLLQPSVVNIGEIVANMENMLRRLIGEHIEFDLRRDLDLKMAEVDPGQIEQVIMNLFVNARDAMPQGGKIAVSIDKVALDDQASTALGDLAAGDYVMLSISDTGVGMGKETLSRIFEPFYTTKGPDEGTGLGLSTVFGIMKQSGGGIEVQSEPDKGSTFRIYLPQAEASAPVAKEKEHATSAGEGCETIMVVEDTEMIRELLNSILERLGYTVLTANNGPEAILMAKQYTGPIDLLITDVVMPKMSGIELAEQLAPLRPEMPVLYMSGYDEKMVTEQGLTDVGRQFLQKPFYPKGIARKIREILDGRITTR